VRTGQKHQIPKIVDSPRIHSTTPHYEMAPNLRGKRFRTPSPVLVDFSPASISKATSHILVSATLKPISSSSPPTPPSLETPIFALGNVAQTPGPKMACAGYAQACIASSNIISIIHNHNNHPTKPTSQKKESNLKLKEYVPVQLEGILNMCLGRGKSVMYVRDHNEEFLYEGIGGRIWRWER